MGGIVGPVILDGCVGAGRILPIPIMGAGEQPCIGHLMVISYLISSGSASTSRASSGGHGNIATAAGSGMALATRRQSVASTPAFILQCCGRLNL